MVIENKTYRLAKWAEGWRCEEVTDAESAIDMAYCLSVGLPYNFTIRRFTNGAMFLLYSPHATPNQISAQADRMASTPGR